MNTIDKKLTDFTSTILNDAKIASDKILCEIESEKTNLILAANNRIQAEALSYLEEEESKIKTEYSVALSKKMLENKRKLSAFREEISSSLLDKLSDRLLEFASSKEYHQYILRQLEKALITLRHQGPYVISAKACDVPLIKGIADCDERLKESVIMASESITHGGFILSNSKGSISANMTLDSALKELSSHIFEHVDLSFVR